MPSNILDSPFFESRHLLNSAWDQIKAMQDFGQSDDNQLPIKILNDHEILSSDDTCHIMALPDEIILLIFENVEFSHTNWSNIAWVNRRFNSLVHDILLGYNTARLQFSPYTKLIKNTWHVQRHKRNASMVLLREVYDMYRVDAEVIQRLQQLSGHSSQVCMALVALLKMIISEVPQAIGTRTRADMVNPLERHRIVLFRLRLARAYLSSEALVLMRYTVEGLRQALNRQASTLVRAGWLTSVPPLDFSYYCFFEDCLLRNHATFVWKVPIVGSTQNFYDHMDKINVFAKMFERQEEFLGTNPIDYEDDISWAAMMTMHHEWGRALLPDLTAEQRKMIRQQALLSPPLEEEKDEIKPLTLDTGELGLLQIGNLNLVDEDFDLQFDNLSLEDNSPGPSPAQPSPTPTHSVRLNQADKVHENLMLLTRMKYGDKECMEKALENLDMIGIREKMRKGRETIWSMNLDECIQAVTREVETTELRCWLSGTTA